MTQQIRIAKTVIGGKNPFVLIAGPCVMENEDMAFRHAEKIRDIAEKNKVPFIFKSSYDKANRTSIKSFRGPGLEKGLRILNRIKKKLNVPVLSDVHCSLDVEKAGKILDIIQIPAFLSRQTDLILDAAKTNRAINIKKGQFLAPWDVQHIIEKIESTGNKKILITERGTSFGYNTLVSDFRAIIIMQKFGYPIIFDATHSVQKPAGKGAVSGGEKDFIEPLAKAALVCGANAIFIEVHEKPEKALSDGPNMVRLDKLDSFLKILKKIENAVKENNTDKHR